MSDLIQTSPSLLHRVALPYLVFSGIFMSLLLTSWFLLLPVWARVDVGGQELSMADLQRRHEQLQNDVTALQQKADDALIPTYPSVSAVALGDRPSPADALGVIARVEDLAAQADANPQAVSLSDVSYDAATHVLSVTGDVRGVGLRSMTVLSQFVESVSALPGVAEVHQPTYERVSGTSGPHSPFQFSLSIP